MVKPYIIQELEKKIKKSGDTMTGDLNIETNLLVSQEINIVDEDNNSQLKIAAGRVTGIAEPVANNDAVSKNYIDNEIIGAIGAQYATGEVIEQEGRTLYIV